MGKALKWTAAVLIGLIGLLAISVVVVLAAGRARFTRTFEVAVPSLAIPSDAASLARGKHLVEAVAHCGYCHGPDLGGDYFVNNPRGEGVIVAPNLTAGAGGRGATYVDEDWVRTLRHGITPEGRSVLAMPSIYFHSLGQEDLAAIIAYVKSVPPVDNELPETSPGPLFYALIGAGPLAAEMAALQVDHEAPFAPAPPEGETTEYGAYLANAAQCTACHGEQLAGGQVCGSCPAGPNLTPGGELGMWSKDDFIATIRTGIDPDGEAIDPFMPWQFFRNMTDSELGAMWAYLQSQPALETQVD